MSKDPFTISSVLDFLSKMLIDKKDSKYYSSIKETLGIEAMKGEKKIMFYNVQCEVLDGKSLLEFIDSQNVRLSRQKEELVDLAVKIANLNNRDANKAMEEVIDHYKSGLHSGVGLRDMITTIKEHYPWSSSKKIIMIFVSLVSCLFGIGLYILDLTTDLDFSFEMFNGSIPFNATEDFDDFLSKNNFNFLKSVKNECLADMNSAFKEKNKRNSTILDAKDYELTAWFSIWHCIQPFAVTMIVGISINYKTCCRGIKYSVPDVPDCLQNSRVCQTLDILFCRVPIKALWPLGYLLVSALLVVVRFVPIPALTNIYRFYLDVKSHIKRSKPDFRDTIADIEEKIRKHEALGKL